MQKNTARACEAWESYCTEHATFGMVWFPNVKKLGSFTTQDHANTYIILYSYFDIDG